MSIDLLTYCTNVHPAQSLAEVRRAVFEHVPAVKSRVSPDAPFNVGLRLSALAACQLTEPAELSRFAAELEERDLQVTTLNGFPFGAFHGQPVKEQVYRPDWQETERVAYTRDLLTVLLRLLPTGKLGSVSTVPGCFKPRLCAGAVNQMVEHLLDVTAQLVDIERAFGKCIVLALEPEPGCFLETTDETVSFFQQHLWAKSALRRLSSTLGIDESQAERALRRHLGVCLDTCHVAVEFESPLGALRRFRNEGIEVGKIQVSAGLKLQEPDEQALRSLRAFDEPTYLHQVVVRRDGELRRYIDLPDALETEPPGGEWRVHFHVPVFSKDLGAFSSTQAELAELLNQLALESTPQLEVETYTWNVLPQEFHDRPLVEAIASELRWTRSFWQPASTKVATEGSG